MTPGPSEAQLRPFRGLAWALYLTVTVGFSLLVTVGVVSSVLRMSPPRALLPQPELGIEDCLEGARGLARELEAHRQDLASNGPAQQADVRWLPVREEWLRRFRQLEGRCSPRAPGRQGLAVALGRLERVLDLTTVHAVQLAGEMGPALDALRDALDAGT